MKITSFISILLLVCFYANAQEGMPNDERFKTITSYLEEIQEAYHLPGMAVSITDSSGTIYEKYLGTVTKNDRFLIGSCSKSFTALLILKLQEQGLLNINDPVVNYLDWFQYKDKTISDKITIKNLLQHTSGITTRHGRVFLTDNSISTQGKIAAVLHGISIADMPQYPHQYSNTNYRLLGFIIEKLTKGSYGDYLRAEVLGPLGMKHTSGDVRDDFVASYQYFLYYPILPQNIAYHADNIPEGFIGSTAPDMSIYLRDLMNSYNKLPNTVVSHEITEQLFAPNTTNAANYGLGWGIAHEEDMLMIRHAGLNSSFTSSIVILPELGMSYVVLTNSYDAPTRKLAVGILDILVNKPPPGLQKGLPFYFIRSLPLVALLFLVLLLFTVKKWMVVRCPFSLDLRTWPLIKLVLGLAFGAFWVFFFSYLYEAPLPTIIDYDPSSGYSLLCLAVFVVLLAVLRSFISAAGSYTKPLG